MEEGLACVDGAWSLAKSWDGDCGVVGRAGITTLTA